MSSTALSIDLLRHGDTGHRSYRGQLDDSLLQLGWRQMRDAVLGRDWDVVVSSPLQRCAAFAQELAQARGLPLALEPRLREYHFGAWQGLAVDVIAAEQGEALARFWADPVAHPPPAAERFGDFAARLTAAADAIAHDYAGQRVLVVTHGGVIRLLRCLSVGRRYTDLLNIDVAHASLHALSWPPKAAARESEAAAQLQAGTVEG
ncbi:histidine phosphatase family protein [Pseudomonas sp. CGJS7]|jgi:alpha-ribazole phosphatase|uniref:histidine phosphatase family protein n=1 Tax=Pseudomonas sp. CGJS7 TaxID=3109348 RepID=UPI00300A115D